MGPRRHPQPREVVAGETDVREHSRRVLVEMEECPRTAVEDAGRSFDEAVGAPEFGQQVADPFEIGGRGVPHDRESRPARVVPVRVGLEAAPAPGDTGVREGWHGWLPALGELYRQCAPLALACDRCQLGAP